MGFLLKVIYLAQVFVRLMISEWSWLIKVRISA